MTEPRQRITAHRVSALEAFQRSVCRQRTAVSRFVPRAGLVILGQTLVRHSHGDNCSSRAVNDEQ
jgi:hypothetical protein